MKTTPRKTPRIGRPKTVRMGPKRRNIKTPSLTAGRYVIYSAVHDCCWDRANNFDKGSIAGVATFENKADATAALVSIQDDWKPGTLQTRPYSDFADTHYYFSHNGEMEMQIVSKGAGTSYADAKKSARNELVKVLDAEKKALIGLQKQFERDRKQFLKDIADTERDIARFDRNSERK